MISSRETQVNAIIITPSSIKFENILVEKKKENRLRTMRLMRGTRVIICIVHYDD